MVVVVVGAGVLGMPLLPIYKNEDLNCFLVKERLPGNH